MARRNRDLAGLAALGALGMAMARMGKKGPDEAEPPVDDRTGSAQQQTARGEPTIEELARGSRDLEGGITPQGLNEYGDKIGLQTPASSRVPARPAAPTRASAPAAAASQAAPARPAASAASAAQPARAASAAQPASSPQAAPAASAAKSASKGLTLGTPTRPAEGAPSIYAGPEAWAAYRQRQAAGMKKGGTVKMASGGSVSSASKRGDGIAQRGKTRGRII